MNGAAPFTSVMCVAREAAGPSAVERRSMTIVAITCCCALGLVAAVPAQLSGSAPTPPQPSARQGERAAPPTRGDKPTSGDKPTESRGVRPEWHEMTRWSAAESRAAFAACDPDADDRLSVLEAAKALEHVGGPQQVQTFRRLDRDRDGYLDWPEFDARCHEELTRQGVFRVRLVRPLVLRTAAPADEAPPEQSAIHALLQTVDRDGDGEISRTEFDAMLATAGLPPSMGAHFTTLDRDASGRLAGAELEPLLLVLPQLGQGPANPRPQLPAAWRAADVNQDGVLDRTELQTALAAAGPTLARWSDTLLRRADRNGNGSLGPSELRAAEQPDRGASNAPEGTRAR